MSVILGVRIDSLKREDADKRVRDYLNGFGQHKIFTPNPEMLVLAQENRLFRDVLNNGDLNLCDGFGATLASLGKIKRIPGADFVWDLCNIAAQEKKTVFLLGSGSWDVLEKTKKMLNNKIVQLNVVDIDPGPVIEKEGDSIRVPFEENEKLLKKINDSEAEVLIVAFGQLKQEIWIDQFLYKLPKVKIAIGVGGALDYISGKVRRAPKFLRIIGLEWLWRLIKEPWRVQRVFNATIKFIYLKIKN